MKTPNTYKELKEYNNLDFYILILIFLISKTVLPSLHSAHLALLSIKEPSTPSADPIK